MGLAHNRLLHHVVVFLGLLVVPIDAQRRFYRRRWRFINQCLNAGTRRLTEQLHGLVDAETRKGSRRNEEQQEAWMNEEQRLLQGRRRRWGRGGRGGGGGSGGGGVDSEVITNIFRTFVPLTCTGVEYTACGYGFNLGRNGTVVCANVTCGDDTTQTSRCINPDLARDNAIFADACGCCPGDDACAAAAVCTDCACTVDAGGTGVLVNFTRWDGSSKFFCVTDPVRVSMELWWGDRVACVSAAECSSVPAANISDRFFHETLV